MLLHVETKALVPEKRRFYFEIENTSAAEARGELTVRLWKRWWGSFEYRMKVPPLDPGQVWLFGCDVPQGRRRFRTFEWTWLTMEGELVGKGVLNDE